MAAQRADPVVVLMPSPLLGPAVWSPVADRLRASGWAVAVCRQSSPVRTASDALAGFLRSVPADRSVVLVPHSNAGLFVPEVMRRRDVVATVFVDAALPPPDGAAALAPTALRAHLRTLADADGLLPRWTTWWTDSDVDALFPDRTTRLQVEQEQPRLPLAYFSDTVAAPAGWSDRPNAYLAFGDTYADAVDLATGWQWPVTTLDGGHLHLLVAPDQVAGALVELLARLGVQVPTQPR